MDEKLLLELIVKSKDLGIDRQIDYDKFYLYSIITRSTAIEGSTVTEIENQLLFDQGISAFGRSIAQTISVSSKTIKRDIAYLKQKGILLREGSDKTGQVKGVSTIEKVF